MAAEPYESATRKLIEQLRTEHAADRTLLGGRPLLSEVEALREAVDIYERRIIELEKQTMDYCRTRLQLEVAQSLLAKEQKTSKELQATLSAYQCSIGAVGLDITLVGEKEGGGVDTSQISAKANAELANLMSQFDVDDSLTVSPSTATNLKSGSTFGDILLNTSEAPSAAANAADEAKIEKLKSTISAMKGAMASLHAEKTAKAEEAYVAKADVQKLQVQFTKVKQSLEEERTKKHQMKEKMTQEVGEYKQRMVEEEHRSKLQLQRQEEKASKEIASLTKTRDSLQREVDRLKHFEERHIEMEEQLRSALSEQKRVERACDEATKSAEGRYQSLLYHIRRRFAEMSDAICGALPASAGIVPIQLPQPPPQSMSMKQLGEPEFVAEVENTMNMVNYLTTLVKPVVRDEILEQRRQRREAHATKMEELKEEVNKLILSLGEHLKKPPIAEVADRIEDIVDDENDIRDEYLEVTHDGIDTNQLAAENRKYPDDTDDDDDSDAWGGESGMLGEGSHRGSMAFDMESSAREHTPKSALGTTPPPASIRRGSLAASSRTVPSNASTPQPRPLSKQQGDSPRSVTPQPNAGTNSVSPGASSMLPPISHHSKRDAAQGRVSFTGEQQGPRHRSEKEDGVSSSAWVEGSGPQLVNKRTTRRTRERNQVAAGDVDLDGDAPDESPRGVILRKSSLAATLRTDATFGSMSVVSAGAPTTTRRQQQTKASYTLAEALLERDSEYQQFEDSTFTQREDNLQFAADLLRRAHEVTVFKKGPKAVKKLDKINLDRSSPLGRPREILPKGRAGGAAKGKKATGAPLKRTRSGPPKKAETPDLHVGQSVDNSPNRSGSRIT